MDFQKFITEFGRTLSIHLTFRWITAEKGGNTVEFKLWTGDRPVFLKSVGVWIPAGNGELRGVLRCQAIEMTEEDFAEVDFGTMISDVTDRTHEQKTRGGLMTNFEKLKTATKEDIARMMCAGTDCAACGVASKCNSEAGGYIAWLDSADNFPGPKDYPETEDN